MINKDNLQEYILSFILFARFLVLSKITSLWRIVYVVHHARRVVLTASLSSRAKQCTGAIFTQPLAGITM
jgi:hypothetical protein